MSRNLGMTSCAFCGAEVVLIEQPRPVKEEEVGVYYLEPGGGYQGMIVAKAECFACLAPYLAWVGSIPHRSPPPPDAERKFQDLSHYHSFNDEPNERDLPRYDVEIQYVRTGLYSGGRGGAYIRLGPAKKPAERNQP